MKPANPLYEKDLHLLRELLYSRQSICDRGKTERGDVLKYFLNIIIVLFIFVGCSTYKLVTSVAINKESDIKVLILPLDDKSGNYKSSFQTEQMIADKINSDFKGIGQKYGSANHFTPMSNPYIVKVLQVNQSEDVSTIYQQFNPDILLKCTIELMDYSRITNSDLIPVIPLTKKLSIGLDTTDNNIFMGIVIINLELINAKNSSIIIAQTVRGESRQDSPEKLFKNDALNDALKDAMGKVPDAVLTILSSPE